VAPLQVRTTISMDYADVERWLPKSDVLISYCSGPYADEQQSDAIEAWLQQGGRWLALHGSAGGRAIRMNPEGTVRKFVKQRFHDVLGCFFMNHPPIMHYNVHHVDGADHPMLTDVPSTFEVEDELYMVQLTDPENTTSFLQTEYVPEGEMLEEDYHFFMDFDPAPDGKTRVLGYERTVGEAGGGVVYIGPGHSNTTHRADVDAWHDTWDNPAYKTLLSNGVDWACQRQFTG